MVKSTSPSAKPEAKRRPAAVAHQKVTGQVSSFMRFVREQGIVGLAVGLAIGAQAAELVKIIVGSLITPLIDLLVGKGGLAALKWTLEVGDRTAVFTFGDLIDALIRFLAVAFVIYLVIHGLKLDRLDKKKEA
ncbi:MAG TPA: MscL family protein [Candidatus Saccharimonadales bacterium]